jgi:PEGA domain
MSRHGTGVARLDLQMDRMDQGGTPVSHRLPLAVATLVGAIGLSVLSPSVADAQPRRVRGRVVIGGFYDPFFYRPFYGPFGFGYGWGAYPYGAYGPYGVYGYGRPDGDAEARIQVTPKDAEVYVDGYRAGRVDDFDGTFQRLHVAPGPHELTVYLPGYRTLNEKLYFGEGSTMKVKETLDKLAPGETSERPPAPAPRRSRSRTRTDDDREP